MNDISQRMDELGFTAELTEAAADYIAEVGLRPELRRPPAAPAVAAPGGERAEQAAAQGRRQDRRPCGRRLRPERRRREQAHLHYRRAGANCSRTAHRYGTEVSNELARAIAIAPTNIGNHADIRRCDF